MDYGDSHIRDSVALLTFLNYINKSEIPTQGDFAFLFSVIYPNYLAA